MDKLAKPGADSRTQFAKAVRHLFRHLHDARALSRNPLVRHTFDDPSIAEFGPARDRSVLARIHQLVRQGAERCLEIDLANGKRERALRQYTIIIQSCLEQRPIRQISEAIGVSEHHCYRERAKICRRVAQFVSAGENALSLDYLVEVDEFRLQIDRTARAAVFGNFAAAIRECDGLVRVAPSTRQKIQALCITQMVYLHFGSVTGAERAAHFASALYKETLPPSQSSSWAVTLAQIDRSAASLALHRGDPVRGLEFADRAVARLAPFQTSAPPHLRELYTECLSDRAAQLWNLGDSSGAYDAFMDAEASLRHIKPTSVNVRTATMVQVWRARNRLLMSSRSWRPSWERIAGLRAVFEQAYASNIILKAIEALIGLTEVYAFADDAAEAMRTGQVAVSLAKQQASEWMKAWTSVHIARTLIRTSHWQYALALFSESQALNTDDAVFHAQSSYLAAERAVRLHRFQDAWRHATEKGSHADPSEIRIRRQIIAAGSALELGRANDALARIEKLIPEAEALGSAPVLRDAYGVAARATGNRQFSRRAREIADLLA